MPNQQVALCERGRDLVTFLAAASAHVMRTLQRPRRSRPGKRRVNHRRFLHNQISRQFADIEAATRSLAASILAQEAPREPAPPVEPRRPGPAPPTPAASAFLGVAEAFVAPEPGPGWGLSVASMAPDPGDLFDPIIGPKELGLTPSWAPITHNPLGSTQNPLPWDPLSRDPLPPPGTEAAPLWAPGPPGYVPPISPGYPVGAAAPGGVVTTATTCSFPIPPPTPSAGHWGPHLLGTPEMDTARSPAELIDVGGGALGDGQDTLNWVGSPFNLGGGHPQLVASPGILAWHLKFGVSP